MNISYIHFFTKSSFEKTQVKPFDKSQSYFLDLP